MFLNFPKNNKKFDKFLPYKLKSGQINKAKALSYNRLYGLFNVLKTLYGAVILWFDHFLDSAAEICQIFCCLFLEYLKTSKRHSDRAVIWPGKNHKYFKKRK